MQSIQRVQSVLIGLLLLTTTAFGALNQHSTNQDSKGAENTQPAQTAPIRRAPKMYSEGSSSSSNLPKAEMPKEETKIKLPKIGEKVKLRLSTENDVAVASDLLAFKDLIKAFKVNDDYGLVTLLRAKEIFWASTNTEALVLDVSSVEVLDSEYPAVKVRILEGNFRGRSGWVSSGWLFFNRWIQ